MYCAMLFVILILTGIGCSDHGSPKDTSDPDVANTIKPNSFHAGNSRPYVEDSDPKVEAEDKSLPLISAGPLPTGQPMLLDFTRTHCMPCSLMAPWVEHLRKKYMNKIGILEINIDKKENKPLGIFFKIHSIPTQVYIDEKGSEIKRHVGLATEPQMESTLKGLKLID